MSLIPLRIVSRSLGAAIASLFIAYPLTATPLEDIQDQGVVTIAVKENVRPLAFRDGTGELQGLEIDIARRLATELFGEAVEVELIPVKNQERLDFA